MLLNYKKSRDTQIENWLRKINKSPKLCHLLFFSFIRLKDILPWRRRRGGCHHIILSCIPFKFCIGHINFFETVFVTLWMESGLAHLRNSRFYYKGVSLPPFHNNAFVFHNKCNFSFLLFFFFNDVHFSLCFILFTHDIQSCLCVFSLPFVLRLRFIKGT